MGGTPYTYLTCDNAMKWLSKPPKREGYYWQFDRRNGQVRLVSIVNRGYCKGDGVWHEKGEWTVLTYSSLGGTAFRHISEAFMYMPTDIVKPNTDLPSVASPEQVEQWQEQSDKKGRNTLAKHFSI